MAAYTPKSAGSALVIGKIVLTMLVAAAKINQSMRFGAYEKTYSTDSVASLV